MARIKFHLGNYQSKSETYTAIEEMITQLINDKLKELNLYYNVEEKKFNITEEHEKDEELIFHLEYDELIKLTAGEYRVILEKEGYEKYQNKIIQQQLKLSKDLTPTYLKHRLPEMFNVKNTKILLNNISDNNYLYSGYKILTDEFVFTPSKLETKDYVYLFKISKKDLIKIIQVDIFSDISVNIW